MRYYKGKAIELLAPAGTFDIFKSVIHAACDAVYFGGSILNMRMIRKGYNFSNEEIESAIQIAHDLDKKVYITVNNLFSHGDLEKAVPYLEFLDSVKADALIIQDFALFQLAKRLNLNLELHSSVMMNVHNLEMIHALKDMGVTRVVTSREMSLATIKNMTENTDMEFEYFAHGDMCVAHGAQCVYSGILFGMSSNRGRCLKPCRWFYDINYGGQVYKTGFPLAVKDMCLYEHLPELIQSGVTSFKLEGRMRDKEFITNLVNLYGQAIDNYIENPEAFDPSQGMKILYDNRKRDLSTGYAFGKPGLNNINERYEGTGKFYSTGKVFSSPTEEKEIDQHRVDEIRSFLENTSSTAQVGLLSTRNLSNPNTNESSKLTVKVSNMPQALMSIEKKVDRIYLAVDQFQDDPLFTEEDFNWLIKKKGQTQLYLAFPKMVTDEQFQLFDDLLIKKNIAFDGLLCTNIGVIHRYGHLNYRLTGDTSLNCYNFEAIKTYMEAGIGETAISLESPLKDVRKLAENRPCPLEITVHGRPTVMYLEHDLYENIQAFEASENLEENQEQNYNNFDNKGILTLSTPAGEYPVYKDRFGRNHMMGHKELCYIDIVNDLYTAGYDCFRIEGATYSPEELGDIIHAYQAKLDNSKRTVTLKPTSAGYTFGALAFD